MHSPVCLQIFMEDDREKFHFLLPFPFSNLKHQKQFCEIEVKFEFSIRQNSLDNAKY